MNDVGNEGKGWQLKLSRFELKGVDYIDFPRTLRGKTSKEEMDEFGSKMVGKINKQRQIHFDLTELLAEGKKIIENRDIKEATKFLNYLEYFRKLAEKMEEEEEIFYSKIGEINKLNNNIKLLIHTQQEAQIVQPSKS